MDVKSWKVYLPLVLSFIIGGLNAVVPVLNPTWQAILMAFLPAIAAYYHLDNVKIAGGTKKRE